MEPGIEATACACKLLYVYVYVTSTWPHLRCDVGLAEENIN